MKKYAHGHKLKLGKENKKQKKIDFYKAMHKEIETAIELLQDSENIENNNLDTIIFKYYLIHENVADVATIINELGYRIRTTTQRKYSSNDITEAITNKNAKVKEPLKSIVQGWQKENYREFMKRYD